jgi:hypothetical protein
MMFESFDHAKDYADNNFKGFTYFVVDVRFNKTMDILGYDR